MCAITTLTQHLVTPRRRTQTSRLLLLARLVAGPALKAAMTIPALRARPRPGYRVVDGDEVTTLTVPTSLDQEANPRPLPWRRMTWVTWRQHRIALGGVAVFLGALAVWLWIAGLQLHHAYDAAIACHPAGSTACSELIFNFDATGGMLKGGFVLQPVPALIGAFLGPLVLAREIETGTFRYAWTQGFGRWRWTLAKLVLLGVAVVRPRRRLQCAGLVVLPAVSRDRQTL